MSRGGLVLSWGMQEPTPKRLLIHAERAQLLFGVGPVAPNAGFEAWLESFVTKTPNHQIIQRMAQNPFVSVCVFPAPYCSQSGNPHTHKNRMATSPPPLRKKKTTPPPPRGHEDFYWYGGFFQQKEPKNPRRP